MLHIVQVVLPGSVETPQVFIDKAKAEAAFVACATTYWKQSYAVYCAAENADADSFAAAQAFVATFDLADRSRVHYWSVPLEDGGADGLERLLPGAALLQERREQIQRLAAEVEQASGDVRTGLTELLETIGGLTATAAPARRTPPSTAARSQPGRLRSSAVPTAPSEAHPPNSTYAPEERQAYVGSIMHLSGGNRSEYKLLTRADWRQAVYSDETTLEYWDWVADQLDEHIEKAQQAGYAVIDDPEQSGCYWFQTPEGVISDVPSKAAGEAWCRAGLHLEGR